MIVTEGKAMPTQTVSGNNTRGEAIRRRRTELGLTIGEAAQKASVGTQTWARYEKGGTIRRDKVPGICRTLKWKNLSDAVEAPRTLPSLDSMRGDPHWPKDIERTNGPYAAASLVIGSALLMDDLAEDSAELRSLPRGTHIGQLGASWIASEMPPRFLTRYDYELVYELRLTLDHMRGMTQSGLHFTPHRVLDEIMLHLIVEEARPLMEEAATEYGVTEDEAFKAWDAWVADTCGDDDIETLLFSEAVPCDECSPYHFSRWLERQFHVG